MSASPAHGGEGAGHESRDVNLRPIVVAAAGLVVVLILVSLAMLGVFDVFADREARLSPPENPLAAAAGRRVPPQPRLQVQPIRDLRELRAAERARLDEYGWVDRAAGVVRIPIDRAIEVLAAKGGEGNGKAP